ncbi:hypothetical protein BSKO_04993 [Bryopsis sp. KO-2023]|nr:hypothetical protein BSKO_04993 [Bryopsis sp. KO-2023]
MATVFVYGTLMDEAVAGRVLGRIPESKAAVLKGYRRWSLKDRLYPGVQKTVESDRVRGKVVSVLQDDMQILDDYEGPEYFRENVTVEVDGDGNRDAFIYLWKEHLSDQLLGDWSFEDFLEQHRDTFLSYEFFSSDRPKT